MFWMLPMRMGQVGNVVVRVYPDDIRKHKRPHFHAVGPDDNIVVGLPLLDIIEGSIAPRDKDRVLSWAAENLESLIDSWNREDPTIPVKMP